MTVRRVMDPSDVTPEVRDFIFRRALDMLARDGEGCGFFVEVDDPSNYWIAGLSEVTSANPKPGRAP